MGATPTEYTFLESCFLGTTFASLIVCLCFQPLKSCKASKLTMTNVAKMQYIWPYGTRKLLPPCLTF